MANDNNKKKLFKSKYQGGLAGLLDCNKNNKIFLSLTMIIILSYVVLINFIIMYLFFLISYL